MSSSTPWCIVGLDNGGNANNATVLDGSGRFLVDGMVESPSRVREGPKAALQALAEAMERVLEVTGVRRSAVAGVGLDTPGPASADGVISSRGSTNFLHPEWAGFDIRTALEELLQLPVVYSNDANAAALYAHYTYFGPERAGRASSVSAIVGTGLGGGVVEAGQVVRGAAGMAGELGHIPLPSAGLLEDGQALPACNCGNAGDVESFASLTGIEKNLLPYWIAKYPDHPLAAEPLPVAARALRAYAEREDPLALSVFEQQAKALGMLFTIAANFTDPHAYFVGGGVVAAKARFREWLLERVRVHTALRVEQREAAVFALVPDLDMAGARGAAIAAREALATGEAVATGEAATTGEAVAVSPRPGVAPGPA
ncbi:ROK family protein [Actinomadura sp. ATCC 31491]|uniref:ROK family protein n=1 Tax=Actinomadura luzonensis TaxID=2805427 RepID=A0ABT0FMF3_9ACTN|nr:ROK family protein [Actinomadura luzonensis]MCK2213457.1 ROK family protein [Actinomadura luzonensis]